MINSYSSKVVAFTMNHTKFLGFKANLTLKVKVKVTSFQNNTRHLDDQQTVKGGRQNARQFNV